MCYFFLKKEEDESIEIFADICWKTNQEKSIKIYKR